MLTIGTLEPMHQNYVGKIIISEYLTQTADEFMDIDETKPMQLEKNIADAFIKNAFTYTVVPVTLVIHFEEVKVVLNDKYCYLKDDEDEEVQLHNQSSLVRIHFPSFYIFTFDGWVPQELF